MSGRLSVWVNIFRDAAPGRYHTSSAWGAAEHNLDFSGETLCNWRRQGASTPGNDQATMKAAYDDSTSAKQCLS